MRGPGGEPSSNVDAIESHDSFATTYTVTYGVRCLRLTDEHTYVGKSSHRSHAFGSGVENACSGEHKILPLRLYRVSRGDSAIFPGSRNKIVSVYDARTVSMVPCLGSGVGSGSESPPLLAGFRSTRQRNHGKTFKKKKKKAQFTGYSCSFRLSFISGTPMVWMLQDQGTRKKKGGTGRELEKPMRGIMSLCTICICKTRQDQG